MRVVRTLLSPALVLGACLLTAAPAHGQAPQAPNLYQRLGGYDAVAAVVDDFVGRLIGDPRFERFFAGQSTDSKLRIRQLVVDQICHLTGGPCVYIGRPMKTAHAGLGITEADWDASVEHLVATLRRFNVPQAEQGELLAAVAALEPDIVERP
jgi:hemoglobin